MPDRSGPFDPGPPPEQPDPWGSTTPSWPPPPPEPSWQSGAAARPGTSFEPEPPAWGAGPAAPVTAATGPEPEIRPVGAPTALLFGATACVVVGALLVIVATGVPAAMLAAWAVAGPIAIVIVGYFLGADADRRSHPYYLQQAWTRSAPLVIVAVGFVVVIASSWFFADWAARQ